MGSCSTEVRGRNYFASGKEGKIKKKGRGLSCKQDDRRPAQAERSVKLHRDGSTSIFMNSDVYRAAKVV